MLIRMSVPGYANKVYTTLHSIIVPMFDGFVPKHQNILAVLRPGGSGGAPTLIPGSNIVTSDGDQYYAEASVGAALTNAFGIHEMASGGTPGKSADRSDFTTIGSSEKAHTGGYPTNDDSDADNTGAGVTVVSYLATYSKSDFSHAAITHGIITNSGPGASEPLLTGYAFSGSFQKTTNDTLKVFVNHALTGV